jgi:pimeloyl-ACP methyl ester carboxylesterase
MPYARASDGIRLHYEVLGRASAPAVLMIQGLGADKHGWDMQRIALATTLQQLQAHAQARKRGTQLVGCIGEQ